jgi:hypothetical protein
VWTRERIVTKRGDRRTRSSGESLDVLLRNTRSPRGESG